MEIKALQKKKLKIYRKPFSIYKDIIYLNNAFHHLTPKEYFKYFKIYVNKTKNFPFQKNQNLTNEYFIKEFIKIFSNFYKFNKNNLFIFSNYSGFDSFLKSINKRKYIQFLSFIDISTGLRIDDINSEFINYSNINFNNNEKFNYNEKKLKNKIKIIDLSLFFSFVPISFDYLLENYKVDALFINLSKAFGLPFDNILFYIKDNNILNKSNIFYLHDIYSIISIISMIRFIEKFGVHKLINLSSRNYYYLFKRLYELNNNYSNNIIKIPEISNKYSSINKDYLYKFPSLIIPIEFCNENLSIKFYDKLINNKIYTEIYKNFILVSPSFYNCLEEFNYFENILLEFINENKN